ncbi:MAG: hypothetical protein NVV73_07340 [Cellvibrionaceae bacterium]|nr:hypothetical protein [Cellvibrionaceae bacterium]
MRTISYAALFGAGILGLSLLYVLQANNDKPTTIEALPKSGSFESTHVIKPARHDLGEPAPVSPEISKIHTMEEMDGFQLNTADATEPAEQHQTMNEQEQANREIRRQERAVIELGQQLSRLRASGDDGEKWLSGLLPMQEEWEDIADEQGVSINFSSWECFNIGCAITISYQKSSDIEEFKKICSNPPALAAGRAQFFLAAL